MANLNNIQLQIVVKGVGLNTLSQMQGSLSGVNTALSGASGAASKANTTWGGFAKRLGDIERNFDAVFRAASHLQSLGSDLTGMGQAGLGMLKNSVDEWGNYEYALNRAAGALGIFDTLSPIYKQLNDGITAVAKEVRVFPADQIAMAVYNWGAATGQTVKSQKDLGVVTKAIIPIMKASAVTHADVEQSIKGVYQVLQQYHKPLSDAADVTEKLQLVSQKTSLEFPDLINAFKMAGAIAPQLGVSFEDMAEMMGRIGDMGIRGGQAGRAMQQMFTKLVDPTARADKELNAVFKSTKGLGKSFNDLVFPNGKFVGTTKYIDMMAQATENMTEKDRLHLLGVITTQNELRVLAPLIDDQIRKRKGNAGAIDQEKVAMADAHKQFEVTFNLLKNSWQGVMGLVSNTIGAVVRDIGQSVAKMATPFIEKFAKMADALDAWVKKNPEIVNMGVKIAAIASVVLIVAGAFFTATGVILAFGAGIAFVIAAAAPFIAPFAAIVAIVVALATNFGGLRDAVADFAGAFIHLLDKLGIFTKATDNTNGALSTLGNKVLPLLESAARTVAAGIEKVADAINWIADHPAALTMLKGLLAVFLAMKALNMGLNIAGIALNLIPVGKNAKDAKAGVQLLIDGMKQLTTVKGLSKLPTSIKELKTAWGMTKDAFSSAAAAIIPALSSVVTAVTGGSLTMSTALRGVLIASGIGLVIAAIGLLVEAWINNWGDIQGKFAAVVAWIQDKFKGIVDFFSRLRDGVVAIWNDITTKIHDAIGNVITFFSELPGKVGNFMNQVWTNVTTWIGSIISAIVAFPGQVWDNITAELGKLVDNFTAWFTSFGDNFATQLGGVLGYLATSIVLWIAARIVDFVNWGVSVLKAVGDWMASLPGLVADWLVQTWNKFTAWFGQVLDGVVKWASGVLKTVGDWFAKLPGNIAAFFTQVWNNLSAWFGKTIRDVGIWAGSVLTSIVNGIKALPGNVMKFFGDLWNNVTTWFGDMVTKVSHGMSDLLAKFVEWAKKVPTNVMAWMVRLPGDLWDFLSGIPGYLWSKLVNIGQSIINGIKKGISDMWGTFTDFLGGFLAGSAKAASESHSPSRIMIPIGVNLAKGLAVGINKDNSVFNAFQSKLNDLSNASMPDMSAALGDSVVGTSLNVDRTLNVNIDVTSKDGTVNNATRDTLKQIFTTEEFVSGLEHMAVMGK